MPTVKVDLPASSGATGLELAVYQDGVLINDDGNDALTEKGGSYGRFETIVSQALAGTYEGVVFNSSGVAIASGYFDSVDLLIGGPATTGSGSPNVVVYPLSSTFPLRVAGTTVVSFEGESVDVTITPTDALGQSVDTTGLTLEVTISDRAKVELETIADGDITKTSTSFTFPTSAANASAFSGGCWACRRTDTKEVISYGQYHVYHAPGA
jgi:hypothetical protein